MHNKLQDMQNDFWNQAEEAADADNLLIASDCEEPLRLFISEGLNQLDEEGLLTDGPSIERAKANFSNFVSEMVGTALEQGTSEVDVSIFEGTVAAFTVWPFRRARYE